MNHSLHEPPWMIQPSRVKSVFNLAPRALFPPHLQSQGKVSQQLPFFPSDKFFQGKINPGGYSLKLAIYLCAALLMRRFGLKTGIHFSYFGLDSGMIFKETEGNVHMYERVYRFFFRWIRKKEKCTNSKWVLRNHFCWRSNVSNNDKISLTWKRV